jgi:hypothetical protein
VELYSHNPSKFLGLHMHRDNLCYNLYELNCPISLMFFSSALKLCLRKFSQKAPHGHESGHVTIVKVKANLSLC